MQCSYGEASCQSLKAAPLDTLVSGLVLEALKPAAIEASLAVVANLESERAALDRHWRQRLERARYEVERARRQYAAVEPENRLVARTLERDWEAALTEQARLEAEHERVKRARKEAPSAAELAAIRDLSQDLPALWRTETTTQQERQTIVRLLLERVLVEVVGDTEKVRVECHWHGGVRTAHELTRPIARLTSLSTYAALTARAAELRREGRECANIAEILNEEG
jgi:exonuclease VII large subunit